MDYFALLEQNTDDAAVQFQLYEACKNGAGNGEEEAQQWLQRAAEQGYAPALDVLNAQKEAEKNQKKQYSDMPMLSLLDIAEDNYDAAAEMYRRMWKKMDYYQRVEACRKICAFEEATLEDYENLMLQNMALCTKSLNRVTLTTEDKLAVLKTLLEDCDNAIEYGSVKAKNIKLNLMCTYYGAIDIQPESILALSENIARSGDYIDKFCHYILLGSKIGRKVQGNDMRLLAWREALMDMPERNDYPALSSYVYLDAEDYDDDGVTSVKPYAEEQHTYSRELSAALFALAVHPSSISSKALDEKIGEVKLPRHFLTDQFCLYTDFLSKKSIREAKKKAQREAEEKAKREAEEKAKREAEEKAKREAQEKEKPTRKAQRKKREDKAEKGLMALLVIIKVIPILFGIFIFLFVIIGFFKTFF